jgi:uncharacterized protein (TIGR02453 family)
MAIQSFSGFPKDLAVFLAELKKNNKKTWFDNNRARYQTVYRSPAKAFSEIMAYELQKLTRIEHTPKIFRINRDIRFSKDKTPYNTHLHISFLPNGTKPAWMFGLAPDYLTLGVGSFGFEKSELESYRARVAGRSGIKLTKNLEVLIAKGARIAEPELKRVPREFPQDHPRAELLRQKSLLVWMNIKNPKAATKPSIIDACRKNYRTLKPVFDWLADL